MFGYTICRPLSGLDSVWLTWNGQDSLDGEILGGKLAFPGEKTEALHAVGQTLVEAALSEHGWRFGHEPVQGPREALHSVCLQWHEEEHCFTWDIYHGQDLAQAALESPPGQPNWWLSGGGEPTEAKAWQDIWRAMEEIMAGRYQ